MPLNLQNYTILLKQVNNSLCVFSKVAESRFSHSVSKNHIYNYGSNEYVGPVFKVQMTFSRSKLFVSA